MRRQRFKITACYAVVFFYFYVLCKTLSRKTTFIKMSKEILSGLHLLINLFSSWAVFSLNLFRVYTQIACTIKINLVVTVLNNKANLIIINRTKWLCKVCTWYLGPYKTYDTHVKFHVDRCVRTHQLHMSNKNVYFCPMTTKNG